MGAGRVAGAKQAVRSRLGRLTGTDQLAARADALEAQVAALEAALADERAAHQPYDAAVAHQGELERHLHEVRDEIATTQRHLQVQAVMDWISGATLRTAPLVSIVLPTRNRAALLPRAVETVLAQSYANWELLIVDDASSDGTDQVLAGFDDPRIRTFAGEGRGVCAARNVALDTVDSDVEGSLVAYLDDDNRMHPEWLRSVVWAFEQQPDTEVLYGAFVIDDLRRAQRRGAGDLPQLVLARYERAALEEHNLTDIGAIAHRAGLPEARFDEQLREMGDWDLFLRLTRDTVPLTLPAIACYYESHAADRLSAGPTHAVDGDRIRSKVR